MRPPPEDSFAANRETPSITVRDDIGPVWRIGIGSSSEVCEPHPGTELLEDRIKVRSDHGYANADGSGRESLVCIQQTHKYTEVEGGASETNYYGLSLTLAECDKLVEAIQQAKRQLRWT